MVILRGVRGDDGCWRKSEEICNPRGKELADQLRKNTNLTLPAILKFSADQNGEVPCMATRTIISRTFEEVKGKKLEKMELADYKWMTYTKVYHTAVNVSKGLLSLDMKPKSLVAVFAETRADWYTFAIGCLNASMTVVTLYTNLHNDSVTHGIVETEVETVVTSYEFLPRLKSILKSCDKVRRVIVFEDQLEGLGDQTNRPESVEVLPYQELIKLGSSSSLSKDDIQGPDTDDVAIIMYTSGSTGNPKGVQLSHRNISSSISAYAIQAHIGPGDFYLAYLPLAHVMELATETALLLMGVSIAYSSPHTLTDISPKILKGTLGDASEARPTVLSAVPLILDRIIKGVTSNVERQGKFKAKLFSESLRYKQSINGDGGVISRLLDAVIFNKVRANLGGRLKMMVVGGAPLSTRTHEMIRAMFGCSLQSAYGLTETAASSTSMDVDDSRAGHCGPPNAGVAMKLESWEEGGYLVTDTPRPRGEILVGGDNVAVGYYKLPELNAQAFVEKDGVRWFRTGDIGEFDESGCLRIIDRMKDLVKLQHGEYVSLGNVEAILKTHCIVDNICIFANSDQTNTVAVVVPSADYLSKVGQELSKPSTMSYAELCKEPDVIRAVLTVLQVHGKNQQLNRFEIPTALYLCSEPWTPDNGLVTAAFKLRRKPLTTLYSEQVAAMYAVRA